MEKRSWGQVRKLGDGLYLLRLSLGYDEFGNRLQPSRRVHVNTEKDAEKALHEFYNEVKNEQSQKKEKKIPVTLKELYEDWLEVHVKSDLRGSTLRYYECLWNKNLALKFGKSKIKTFTPRMVHDILKTVGGAGRVRKGVYNMLNVMFRYGIKMRYIKDNPCAVIDSPKYKAKRKEVYTDEEIAQILKIVDQQPPIYQAIFYLAILLGLRRGEIVGLRWEDIDIDNNAITIRRAATSKKGVGTVEGETKNESSQRKLQLPAVLIPIFQRIHAEQAEDKLKLGTKYKDEGHVFTRFGGEIMGIDRPDRWLKQMRTEYPNIFPEKDLHTLRHTFATYLLNDHVDLATVSGALGHSQQSTTLNIYSHVIEETKKAAIQGQESRILSLKKDDAQ